MLDKELIENNFKKSLLTYNDNAIIQKKMASKLVELLPLQKKYKNILEIGSYTGILTKIATSSLNFDSYLALDIVNSFDFIKNIDKRIDFIKTDIEKFETDRKFDLIIANASLQWCEDFNKTIEKLKSYLNKNGIILFSIFSCDNLFEIKEAFEASLKYPNIDELKEILPNLKIIQKKEVLKFSSSLELLKHLKLTGVNSLTKNKLNYSKIKKGLKIIEEKYQNNLTYFPLYVFYQS